MASTLVLLRHGQSLWNQKNIFTGWVDIGLSKTGEEEARRAGDVLKDYHFDALFTSALSRARDTAKIVLQGRMPKLQFSSVALNERRYGELEGKDKDEMRRLYGPEQVQIWRRSFDKKPPGGESLKDTCDRVLPYFKQEIEPKLRAGETILVAAHGNSLRALVKYLEGLSDEEIVQVEIPTACPIVYRFDDEGRIIEKKVLLTKNA
ncbi:MAG TPA: 2,3-diphosphoglycerate-dependent phosphoglycerate mutase [Myxococcota bacterium]|nr:2,3-diphosphoglycerate-dependent phosphoglycerate mutase [Myxococcota bacterium]